MAIKVKGCTVIDDIKNITAGVSTVTTGCVTGTLTAGTVNGGVVCATSCFSGDGSGLSNIPSGAITGLSGGGGVQTFTSPGTFSVPPGTTTLKITSTGGGASGTPGYGFFNNVCPGVSGSSAVTNVKYLSVPPACSSYPVTIGGAGGNTIFGGPTIFVANGAPDPAACGQPAQANYVLISPSENFTQPSGGAPSIYGRGGSSGPSGSPGDGAPGCGYGAGGGAGGGTCAPPASLGNGGLGAPGFMIVEW